MPCTFMIWMRKMRMAKPAILLLMMLTMIWKVIPPTMKMMRMDYRRLSVEQFPLSKSHIVFGVVITLKMKESHNYELLGL